MSGDICPYCQHPELREGEVCTSLHISVELFDRLVFKTKRKGAAFTKDGTPMSRKYCAVILSEEELNEVLLRAGLTPEYFTR
jgi:pyruvate-formate lyase-activating enzyme